MGGAHGCEGVCDRDGHCTMLECHNVHTSTAVPCQMCHNVHTDLDAVEVGGEAGHNDAVAGGTRDDRVQRTLAALSCEACTVVDPC